MPRMEIGDFSGQYPTADTLDARNIRGGTISAQIIELAEAGGVIRSQQYEPDTDGWAIFADGTALFGDVILTGGGTFATSSSGQRVEITSSGTDAINIYDGVNGSPHVITGYVSGGSYGIELSYLGTAAKSLVISNDVLLFKAGNSYLYGNLRRDQAAGTYDIGEAAYPFSDVFADRYEAGNGSVGSPSFTFYNDTDTGMFRAGANDGRLVAGGSSIAQFTSGTFGPGSDNNFSLGSSGQRWTEVFAANGTINTSDRRYKRSIKPLTKGLDFINQLDPVQFKWKDSADSSTHWGLIAQDLAKLTIQGPYREGEILGINYAELVPALILAIQELSAKLETYESS